MKQLFITLIFFVFLSATFALESDGIAFLTSPEEMSSFFINSSHGTNKQENFASEFITAAQSATQNGKIAECRAWLTCSSGKMISCISRGTKCQASDADSAVQCTAPGVYVSDVCN